VSHSWPCSPLLSTATPTESSLHVCFVLTWSIYPRQHHFVAHVGYRIQDRRLLSIFSIFAGVCAAVISLPSPFASFLLPHHGWRSSFFFHFPRSYLSSMFIMLWDPPLDTPRVQAASQPLNFREDPDVPLCSFLPCLRPPSLPSVVTPTRISWSASSIASNLPSLIARLLQLRLWSRGSFFTGAVSLPGSGGAFGPSNPSLGLRDAPISFDDNAAVSPAEFSRSVSAGLLLCCLLAYAALLFASYPPCGA